MATCAVGELAAAAPDAAGTPSPPAAAREAPTAAWLLAAAPAAPSLAAAAPEAPVAPLAFAGTIRTGAPSTIESCGFRITCSSPCKPDAIATRVPKSVPSDTAISFTLCCASTVATLTRSAREQQ